MILILFISLILSTLQSWGLEDLVSVSYCMEYYVAFYLQMLHKYRIVFTAKQHFITYVRLFSVRTNFSSNYP